MQRLQWMFLIATIASSAFAQPSVNSSLTLAEALRQARERAPEQAVFSARVDKNAGQVDGLDEAFDWNVFGGASYEQDKSETPTINAGEQTRGGQAQLGVKRFWPSGTTTQLSTTTGRRDVRFPEPSAPQILPSGQIIPSQDPSAFQRYDPTYQTEVRLRVSQSLWRNAFAREVERAKEALRGGELTPRYQKLIAEQIVQAETEQQFWLALRLAEQIELTNALLAKSRNFTKLMRRRIRYGRADQVDVASAEALVVAREGALLDLQIAHEEAMRKLAYRINPEKPAGKLQLTGDLSEPSLPLPALDLEKAVAIALENRADLAMLEALKGPLVADLALADEQSKPQWDIFVEAASTGLADSSSEAAEKAATGRRPVWTIGTSFQMALGETALKAKRTEVLAGRQELQAQMVETKRDIKRDLEIAFLALDHSFRKRTQADRGVQSLRKQWQAEKRKVAQARSEEIAALRYEIEMLGARNETIIAQYRARVAEAQIRLALHAYPTK